MAVRIAQGVGQEKHEGELTEGLALGRAGNMVADCFRDTLPSCVVFFFRGEPQEAAKVLHAQMGAALLICIEAVRDEGFAILGNLGLGSGENFGCHLHAEVFVECREGQIAGGAFNDVLADEKGGFVEGFDARVAPIKKFGDHSRNAACGVLIDKFRKGFLGVISLQDFSDFKGLWRGGEVGSGSRNLNAADHVASHHGKQCSGV